MSPRSQNQVPLAVLIPLNLFWSLAATIYDRFAILAVPLWAVPFTVVCPLYPLLLALVWHRRLRNLRPLPWLTAVAALPSAVYGVLSLLFYPLIMSHEGFSWIDLGQILWVLFYGLQGWYLLTEQRLQKIPLIVSGVFMTASLAIQYRTLTFGYLGVDILSIPQRQSVALSGLIAIALAAILSTRPAPARK